jgi:hypothetical protein
VTYDQLRDDLWVTGAANARTIHSSDVMGNNVVLHQIPSGVGASMDVNDSPEGLLVVCPSSVPAPLAPITIEHGLSGKPGHIGVIAMVRPFFLVLAVGLFDAGGKLTSKIPAIGIPPGAPRRFQFLGAAINPSSRVPIISNQVDWPAN